jgi:acetyl-CoA synthetase
MSGEENFESILREDRVFPPSAEFTASAHVQGMEGYEALYARSIADPQKFWAGVAEQLPWFKRWDSVLEWDEPWARWFVGSQTNLSFNCLDHQVSSGRGDKTAILYESEPGEVRTITYRELLGDVQRFANALKAIGVKRGDRVAIYMGMCPELAMALLACARIGAVHSVIFGGFAPHALVDRINDSQCVAVLTQDGSFRRGSEIKLKATVDEALVDCPSVKKVLVHKRSGSPVTMQEGRDIWLQDAMAEASPDCEAEKMDAEDPLYILYTSGTTGKPKGLVHTTAGYAVQTYYTARLVFDLQEEDVYWSTGRCRMARR